MIRFEQCQTALSALDDVLIVVMPDSWPREISSLGSLVIKGPWENAPYAFKVVFVKQLINPRANRRGLRTKFPPTPRAQRSTGLPKLTMASQPQPRAVPCSRALLPTGMGGGCHRHTKWPLPSLECRSEQREGENRPGEPSSDESSTFPPHEDALHCVQREQYCPFFITCWAHLSACFSLRRNPFSSPCSCFLGHKKICKLHFINWEIFIQ